MIEMHNRLIAKRIIERYPLFTFPAGMKGTVVMVTDEEVRIKMDSPLPNCEGWDNCVVYYPENDPQHVVDLEQDWAQLHFYNVEMQVNYYLECASEADARGQAIAKVHGDVAPDLNNWDYTIVNVDSEEAAQ
jgi:hypothetical protein